MKNVFTAYPESKDAALKNISFKIPYQTITLITGPNGSGKTTLLELIIGFLKPLVGELYVLGYKMPKHARKVRLKTGYLPQDFMRSPSEPYTVLDVITMGLAPYLKPFNTIPKDIKKKISWVLRLTGLEGLEDTPVGQLSGGQQQRVMLARVLVRQPQLILLDEPFSSLDQSTRKEVSQLLKEIRDRYKTTIIVVSHVIEPIIDFADALIELREGSVVKEEWFS